MQSHAGEMRAPFPVCSGSGAFTIIAHIDPAPQDVGVRQRAWWMRRGASLAALRRRSMQDPGFGVPRGPRPVENPLGVRFHPISGTIHAGFEALGAQSVLTISSTPTFSTQLTPSRQLGE